MESVEPVLPQLAMTTLTTLEVTPRYSVSCGVPGESLDGSYHWIPEKLNGKQSACVMCGGELKDEALQCDLCNVWEHLRCIKVCNRLFHECYSALTQSVSMSLLFACMKCRYKSILATPMHTTVVDNLTSGKRKLPQE